MGIYLNPVHRGSPLVVAHQTSLICITVAVLHSVASLDCDTIARVEDTAPRTRDRSVVVVRPFTLAHGSNILQFVSAAVVIVLVLGSS